MQKYVKEFFAQEEGNAVIDWVVLVASSMLLALTVVAMVTENVDAITDDTAAKMESIDVNPAS